MAKARKGEFVVVVAPLYNGKILSMNVTAGIDKLTLDEIGRIGSDLYPHDRRRVRLESCPRFIQHLKPLRILVHGLRVRRGQEELDSVIGVLPKRWESSFDDGDGVLE